MSELRAALSSTVLATGTNLRATAERIPRGLSPFNGRIDRHYLTPRSRCFLKISRTIRAPVALGEAKYR